MRRLLVDVKSLLYRYYHIDPGSDLIDKFADQMYFVKDKWRIDEVILAFDGRDSTVYRQELYPAYKGERSGTPDVELAVRQLYVQLRQDFACEVCPGYEADDIIGTLVQYILAGEADSQVCIYSRDSDYHGLLGPRVNQIQVWIRGEQPQVMTAKGVYDKYEIHPYQWLDYRVLVGDSSDNVGGVPGIGPVAARKILKLHGSLEEALKVVDQLPIRVGLRELLKEAHESGDLDLLRKVLGLRTDAPHAWRLPEPKEVKRDVDSGEAAGQVV